MHTVSLSLAISILPIGRLPITDVLISSFTSDFAKPSEAEQGMLGDPIALRDDLLEIDGKHQVHDGAHIDGNQTLLGLLVDVPDGLVAGRVCAIEGHVVEHADVGEGGEEVGEPVHLVRGVPHGQIHGHRDRARPDRHSIADYGGRLRRVYEDAEEEGERDLTKTPAEKDQGEEPPVRTHKEVHLEPKDRCDPVDHDCDEEDQQVEGEVNQPVVAHLHSINLHCFQ